MAHYPLLSLPKALLKPLGFVGRFFPAMMGFFHQQLRFEAWDAPCSNQLKINAKDFLKNMYMYNDIVKCYTVYTHRTHNYNIYI